MSSLNKTLLVLLFVIANSGYLPAQVQELPTFKQVSHPFMPAITSESETTHESKGIGLTQSRLELDKLLNNREDAIQITDKVNTEGHPAGTMVALTFKGYAK